MPSDSCDHRQTTTAKSHQPPEPEHLPCPRCDSTNTKFCYYNFSQPRHFCKACRRYWTHGGTLRDIPIGGGTRKNPKRSLPQSHITTHRLLNSVTWLHLLRLLPFAGENGAGLHFFGDVRSGVSMSESFTSLLNNTQGPGGFFGVGGFEDGNFGIGRAIWPFSGMGLSGGGWWWKYMAGGGRRRWRGVF